MKDTVDELETLSEMRNAGRAPVAAKVGTIESYVGLGNKTEVGPEAPFIKAALWFLILFTCLAPNLLLIRVAF